MTFVQHYFHLPTKSGRQNVFALTSTVPFSIWARKLAVAFLLRCVAAPADALVHQCIVALLRWHLAGQRNWLSVVLRWMRAWDPRFDLQISQLGGWDAATFVPTQWDPYAVQRRWNFPGYLWRPGPQAWLTRLGDVRLGEFEWRSSWADLVGWGKRVAARYAAWERNVYFLRTQLGRMSHAGQFAKCRFLYAAWCAGAPVGLPLPLVAPRAPSPRQILEGVVGPARRSVAARLLTGDLDIAAYSGNWDINRRYLPSRACAYCYWDIGVRFVEDEWHVFLICPLYSLLRRSLRTTPRHPPLTDHMTAQQVRVEGHELQGDGCTPRNLAALAKALLTTPKPGTGVDFLIRALKLRRQYRERMGSA